MAEAGPEIPRVEELVGEHGHKPDRYGQLIAIATVLTTLIGACVAFAQAGALRTHDRADSRAETYGTLALEASAVNLGHAHVILDRLNLATAQVRYAANASLFQTYGTASKATALTATRWNAIASQTEADTAAIAKSEAIPYVCSPSIQPHCPAQAAFYSPEQDPRFPTRYVQQSQDEAYVLTALRDASNQAADDAESHFVYYAAALTMLAVSVFLLGYSLTPQGRQRRLLYSRSAACLVLVAGVWALVQVLSPVRTPPAQAATSFANGEVSLNGGDYHAATVDFTHAIEANGQFTNAYAERARAEFGAGFPHTGTGVGSLPTTAGPVTIPTTASLRAAIADQTTAHNQGSDSATLLLDLGRNLLYLGVLERNSSDLSASRDYLQDSLDQMSGQDDVAALVAGARLRIAEDDLALGNPSTSEFAAGLRALQAPGVPRESAVAASLTDLSLIELRYPSLEPAIEPLRGRLVAAGEAGSTTPTGAAPSPSTSAATPAKLSGVTAQPDPGHALYTIDKSVGFDPSHDRLSVQWEYKDPLHGEWSVLPEISGPVGPGGLTDEGGGSYASSNEAYVASSDPATCLPGGKYKVELFVNGQLAGSATGSGDWAGLHAVRLPDVDGAMCVPDGWQAVSEGAGFDGYISSDGNEGAALISVPQAAAPEIADDQSALASFMTDTVQGMGGGSNSLLPGVKSAQAVQSTPFFMSSDNGQYELWSAQEGQVFSGVGSSSNGQIYVGITWGPANGDLAQNLFLSLSPL